MPYSLAERPKQSNVLCTQDAFQKQIKFACFLFRKSNLEIVQQIQNRKSKTKLRNEKCDLLFLFITFWPIPEKFGEKVTIMLIYPRHPFPHTSEVEIIFFILLWKILKCCIEPDLSIKITWIYLISYQDLTYLTAHKCHKASYHP